MSLRRASGRRVRKHFVERVRLMGIIDEDRRAVTAADEFEPAGGAFEIFQRGEDPLGRAARRQSQPRGDERILNLEVAGERQMHGIGFAGIFQRKRGGEILGRGTQELDGLAFSADREETQATRGAGRDHSVRDIAVGFDHRRLPLRKQRVEQAQLRREIGFHVRMIIEMVARQIGEGAGREPHAIEPALIEPMRRGLEGEMRDAVPRQLVERLVQRDRVRRRQRAIDFAGRRDETDRAERGGAMAERKPDLPGEGRDRAFAARAGDGSDGRRLARIKARRGERQGPARVRHFDEDRRRNVSPGALADDGDGAARHRLRREDGPVGFGAGQSEKSEIRAHGAAVGAEARQSPAPPRLRPAPPQAEDRRGASMAPEDDGGIGGAIAKLGEQRERLARRREPRRRSPAAGRGGS